ncbi:MAG: rod shape-determining protein MreD [Alphaproteobacteria bacterium]|nr:rod shape-determining protein MreD [Alphaproteobacteria bacterium]
MNAVRRPALASFGFAGFIPVLATFFMAILMLLPLGTGAANIAMPHLVLASTFYWLSSRAILLPYGACAILGVFLDLWLDVPMGMNMLLLILTRLFVLNQLKHYKGRSRFVHWAVFTVLALALYLLSWLISSAVHGTMIPPEPIALQWMVTSFSYAPIGFLMGRLRRAAM